MVKQKLGVAISHWDKFMYRMKILTERKVKSHEAMKYFHDVLCSQNEQDIYLPSGKGIANERALTMYEGNVRGAELSAAKDIAWGLLFSITEFVDDKRQARSTENRLNSAWFGNGAAIKQKALNHALQLAA